MRPNLSLYLFSVYTLFPGSSFGIVIDTSARFYGNPFSRHVGFQLLVPDTDSQSSEAPLSPSPSFAGNTATPFYLLACESTRASFAELYVLQKRRTIQRRGPAYSATYTHDDSSGVPFEDTSSAGQDCAGTKRDLEGCLGKIILITAGGEIPERQQRIMEEATVNFALGRSDAPRRSHATNCQDS